MKFKMIHENYNVSDLDRSIKFYNEALDLHEVRRKTAKDFIIVYLSNEVSDFELELTWLKEHPQPYNLGECEFALKMKRSGSILSKIRMATGLKFCRKAVCYENAAIFLKEMALAPPTKPCYDLAVNSSETNVSKG